MHLVGGVDKPTAGHVWLQGTDLYKLDENALAIFRRRQIGLVYQFYNLLPVLNVRENLTLPLLLDGRNVNKNQLEQLAQILGIQDRMNHLPHQLSGGQQQRVSIGRALITSPALLLADEPTGNLDSKNSAEVMALLRYFHEKKGQTLLVITHDERIACQADRLITVEDGHIAQDEAVRP